MEILQDIISNLLAFIVTVLPSDPFIKYIDALDSSISKYIGWLNWFIPFDLILKVFVAWLASITLFYIWMTLARWIKLIGE